MKKEFVPHQNHRIKIIKKKKAQKTPKESFGAEFITTNSKQTQKLGEILAKEIKTGMIVCMTGDLGAGKTTFTQGLLKGLKIKGPHTSPTFVIMKKYKKNIFHIDAYRIGAEDMINLGWEEIIADNQNIVIIEWAEKIYGIIPERSLWVKFQWLSENKRKLIFSGIK